MNARTYNPAGDPSARTDSFRHLQPGWSEGRGEAFQEAHLRWLDGLLARLLPELPTPPYLYPLEDHRISAEWDIPDGEITLEFDLPRRTADLYIYHPATTDTSATFDLSLPLDLDRLVTRLKQFVVRR